jgi:hypothetical protein
MVLHATLDRTSFACDDNEEGMIYLGNSLSLVGEKNDLESSMNSLPAHIETPRDNDLLHVSLYYLIIILVIL